MLVAKLQSLTINYSAPADIGVYLDALVETGRFGRARNDAALELVLAGIRKHIKSGLIPKSALISAIKAMKEDEAEGYGAYGCGVLLRDNPHHDAPRRAGWERGWRLAAGRMSE